jgi:hypothetical protein
MIRTFPKFVVRLACLAVAVHICFSGLLTFVVEKNFTHRMLNVRSFEPDDHQARMELIASFFHIARRDDRPLIGFFGSSFTYGYPFPPWVPLSNATAEAFPDHRVVNASLLAGGLESLHASIQLAGLKGCRFETLVLEIPVVNETSWMQQKSSNWRANYAETRSMLADTREATYFKWFLRRPGGVRYLAILFEELTLNDEEISIKVLQPSDGYFATREGFAAVRKEYSEKLAATLRAAQEISDRVVVFPTPIFLAGGDRIRYDTAALREQIDATYAACRSVEGVSVLRLDERFFSDEKLFSNLTHLGLHGNQVFGTWLAAELVRPSGEEAIAGTKTSGSARR